MKVHFASEDKTIMVFMVAFCLPRLTPLGSVKAGIQDVCTALKLLSVDLFDLKR